jgi:hypothetical protein
MQFSRDGTAKSGDPIKTIRNVFILIYLYSATEILQLKELITNRVMVIRLVQI